MKAIIPLVFVSYIFLGNCKSPKKVEKKDSPIEASRLAEENRNSSLQAETFSESGLAWKDSNTVWIDSWGHLIKSGNSETMEAKVVRACNTAREKALAKYNELFTVPAETTKLSQREIDDFGNCRVVLEFHSKSLDKSKARNKKYFE